MQNIDEPGNLVHTKCFEGFWYFDVCWFRNCMMPLGKHWAIFFRTILKSPLSAKTLLYCLRVLRGAATNYRIQTERPRLREFVISINPCTIVAFLCYAQIIYNTNTYLWTASNVRIPIITVIITYFWWVRKSHAVKLSMYCYHFITIGASGEMFNNRQ